MWLRRRRYVQIETEKRIEMAEEISADKTVSGSLIEPEESTGGGRDGWLTNDTPGTESNWAETTTWVPTANYCGQMLQFQNQRSFKVGQAEEEVCSPGKDDCAREVLGTRPKYTEEKTSS